MNKVTFVRSILKIFLRFSKKMLGDFITHNYVAQWQDNQFKESLCSLPNDVVLSIIDFTKNYTFIDQNEVQEAHWHSLNITILVHITYHLNLTRNPDIAKTRLLKEIHFYIFDDGKHTHSLCNIAYSCIGSI